MIEDRHIALFKFLQLLRKLDCISGISGQACVFKVASTGIILANNRILHISNAPFRMIGRT